MRLPDWFGFRGKTLWDWLQLLIVPAILIGVTFAWSALQTSSDNAREEGRIAADRAAAEEARQDATLQTYLDQMSGLMLKEKLLGSKDGSAVRAVARTVTLTTLRRLNESRKGKVVRFLHEARLIERGPVLEPDGSWRRLNSRTRVHLDDADLGGANLGGADLEGADLISANLRGTNLRGAYLMFADLTDVDLKGADLANANLFYARLTSANLTGAHLAGANLTAVDLGSADLSGVNLSGADLSAVNFLGADLRGANLRDAILRRANANSARNLDLDNFIATLSPERKKAFLDSQKDFLDSLSPAELAKFNLTPEKLATFRREGSEP